LSAAKVTAADAANLLIAIMGSPISGAAIKEAARTCILYGTLPWIGTVGLRKKLRLLGFARLSTLPAEHSLHDALVVLIEDAVPDVSGHYSLAYRNVRIQLNSPTPWAGIYIDRGLATEPQERAMIVYHSHLRTRSPKMAAAIQKDLRQTRRVTFDTVKQLAAIVRSG
jgi:hypothetical protein